MATSSHTGRPRPRSSEEVGASIGGLRALSSVVAERDMSPSPVVHPPPSHCAVKDVKTAHA